MRTRALHRLAAVASLAGALLVGACGDFNVTNPNQPTLDDLVSNPTRTKLSAAATGLFIGVRTDITGVIWRLGSMGREGVNLSGNNQPDYIEPYFGPLSGTGFGGTLWANFYREVRSANIYLTAAPKAAQVPGTEGLSAGEVSASLGFGKTMKALALMYVIAGHGSLGAPVDVDHPITDPPAPFVSEDSVYGYIIATLNEAQSDLQTAGSTAFPFPTPPGYSGFDTPATFLAFNRALAAKAYVFRATAASSTCGTTCYTNALAALVLAGPGFGGIGTAGQLATGVYFDFSANAGDTQNDLSDALNAPIYFAVPILQTQAQTQSGGALDQRVVNKVVAATANPPQQLNAIPILGTLKFTNYLTGGNPDPAAPIPVIKNEELVLLRAEAEIGLNGPGDANALADINTVRSLSGNLPPLGSLGSQDQAITELLYNRRYSLLWEQGATWVDARRYGRIITAANGKHQILGIGELPGFGTGSFAPSDVPLRLLAPDDECRARGLESGCNPLGT